MIETIVSFWGPILFSLIMLLVHIEASFQKRLVRCMLLSIAYTAFVLYAATFFDLVIIFVLICLYFWLMSFSVYYAEKHTY